MLFPNHYENLDAMRQAIQGYDMMMSELIMHMVIPTHIFDSWHDKTWHDRHLTFHVMTSYGLTCTT